MKIFILKKVFYSNSNYFPELITVNSAFLLGDSLWLESVKSQKWQSV